MCVVKLLVQSKGLHTANAKLKLSKQY